MPRKADPPARELDLDETLRALRRALRFQTEELATTLPAFLDKNLLEELAAICQEGAEMHRAMGTDKGAGRPVRSWIAATASARGKSPANEME